MRYTPLEFIVDGAVVGKPIYDDDGRVLLKKGAVITGHIKRRLNNYGIYGLYLEDPYSNEEIEDVLRPEIRNRAIMAIKSTFMQFQKDMDSQGKPSLGESMLRVDRIAESVMGEMLENRQMVVHMVDIKTKDNFLFQHAINVSVLSLIIGIRMKLESNRLKLLSMGAMLHDIGKLFYEKEFLMQEHLSKDQMDFLKGHVQKGYDFLRGSQEISSHVRMVAFQHHENVDGSGYPRGLLGEAIHPLAKIVKIANDYDNLTSRAVWKPSVNPNEAIEYIMAKAGREYDFEIAKIFVDSIIPYPNGTHVRLSDKRIGVVVGQNKNMPLRPIVRLLGKGSDQKSVDLIEEINLIVEEIIYD